MRKPYQGVWNIVRFNWHFYLLSLMMISLLFLLQFVVPESYHFLLHLFIVTIIFTTFISLIISFYIYDCSSLYRLDWLDKYFNTSIKNSINIHAGFDETSVLLNKKFSDSNLKVFDFYDPKIHTEISIKRARKAYPPYPNTKSIQTHYLPLESKSADAIFVLLSAHEIREKKERNIFFRELKRVLKIDGKIIIVEHLRDIPNFLAYTIGFFHFYPKSVWLETFQDTNLRLVEELKITPFISTFILSNYGNTP
ncbi:MAG: methyltransferase domain-containing protein [Bacteroidota bacterium]